LVEGQPREATQTAEERFRYEIEIGTAGIYLVRVEQRGLDLKVVVEAPGGAKEAHDSPALRDGEEIAILSAGPGRYRVEVYSDESTNARGGHAIALVNVTNVSASELEAWRLVDAAGVANFAGGAEGSAKAADAYERAAQLWRELGRAREQADALLAAANVEYRGRFAYQLSAALAAASAELYGQLGDAALAANALHFQGAALVEEALKVKQSAEGAAVAAETEALFAEALRLLTEARATHEQLGRIYDLGKVLNNFGYTYYSKGEYARARPYYEQAAVLFGSAGEWGAQVQPLANSAVIDAEEGRLASAIATFEKMLQIMPPGKLLPRRAIALENLGATHLLRGDAEVALPIFAEALDVNRARENEQGEGRLLRRLGEAYYTLGELDLAEQYLQQALPLAERTNDARTQESVLRNLGNVAFLRRDYAAALDFHRRALERSASIFDRAHLQVLVTKDLVALGRGAEARAAAVEARSFAQSSDSQLLRALADAAAGRVEIAAGDPAAAVARLESAAAAFARFGMRAEHADALHGLSLAARAANRIDAALEHGAAALDELELMRSRVADPQLRAVLASARREYYETQIDLLMARARDERATAAEHDSYVRAALEVSERGRARMIADLLREAAIDLRAGIPAAVRAKEDELYEQLADRRRQRDLLLERSGSDAAKAAELERVVADLAALENDLNLVEIDSRRRNPRYATLTAPETLGAAEIQRMLGADTVLLQYSLGESASWVWAVTSERVVAVELRDRATIEAAARRAIARLEKHSPDSTVRSAPELEDLAALVIAPVAASLNRPRIALALDGALQFVPFSVLPQRGPDGNAAPLLAQHEVIEVPSTSVLALSPRGAAPAQRKTLAVFADPVVEPSDPRFGAARPELFAATANEHGFAARSFAAVDLGRLLSTGYEGEAIAALVPDASRLLARGFAANRDAVLDSDLEGFRYIHFATHGLVDARYPGLSALVLSQFDQQGRPLDGFLRLNDIYNLKLDAELVVLSACETALGREVRGEGLIGLTQGFMTAGARSVVASLWQVPDRATAELMRQFYSYMLDEGLAPAAALRKAQLASAAERRWSDPYFWGGFVLVGDWR
jgi:CHAT domain-containing protein/tetratricopeptide (TPR) repeat protein